MYLSQPVYLVDWCPAGTSESLAARCARDSANSNFNYTYLLDVPVISSNSGIIYQNIFCGKCHKETYYKEYIYDYICDCEMDSIHDSINLKYQPGNLTWIGPRPPNPLCLEQDSAKCILRIDFPVKTGTLCEENLIDECKANISMFGKTFIDGCINGDNYYIQDKDSNVYKNVNCILCNGMGLIDLICLQPYVTVSNGVERSDLWTISDLFSFGDHCDITQIYDPLFGNCDILENLPDILINVTGIPDIWPNSSVFENVGSDNPSASSIIFTILMTLSIICLFFHMLIFIFNLKNRNLHSKNLFCLTVSLFVAEFFFLFGANLCVEYINCYILTIIVYFSFLAGFLWMNVISFDICKTFLSPNTPSHSGRTFLKYSAYAWGVALTFTLCAIMVDQLASESKVAPGFADRGFWISKTGGLLLFFVIPVEILFVFNLVMLVKSANSIRKQKKINKVATSSVRSKTSTSSSMTQKYELDEGKLHKIITDKVKKSLEDHADDIEMLKLIVSLAILMGIPWIFSVFINVSIVFEYLFNIFNSLQGVFIFLAFDCRQKTWEVIKGTCCKSRSNVVNSTTQVIKINLSTSSSREEGPSSSAKKSSRSKDSSKMRGSSCTSRSTVDTVISHDTGGRSDETKQTLLPNPLDSIETENFAARQSRVSHSQSVVLESDSSQFKREQVTLIIHS